MKGKKIRWGLLGGGPDSLIGIVHRVAAYMGEDYALVGGVFNVDQAIGRRFAVELELDPARAYATVDALIAAENQRSADDRMSLVTVATPNYLHYDMAAKLLQGGFHVVCEKPVTATAAQASELAALVKARGSIFAVAHTYTGYPMVRQMRGMISRGAIGAVQRVNVQYLQGWINPVIHDRSKWKSVWRLDPKLGGQSCCIGDIGVHAFNLIEYTSGLTVTQSLADINTLYPDNPLDVDGSALLRLSNGAKGVLSASQIATGEENNLQIAVYGRTGALKWAQENPNRLEYLREGEPLAVITPGHASNEPAARAASKLPPGHPEGFIDAMGNIYRGVAKAIRGEAPLAGAFPGVEDGVRGMRFVEAVLDSARNGSRWVTL
jgi:predicted dehydrogenase